jgi:hypothetical protein
MLCLPINAAAAAVVAKSRESTGSYGPVLLGLGLLCLGGGACAMLIRERRGKHLTLRESPPPQKT